MLRGLAPEKLTVGRDRRTDKIRLRLSPVDFYCLETGKTYFKRGRPAWSKSNKKLPSLWRWPSRVCFQKTRLIHSNLFVQKSSFSVQSQVLLWKHIEGWKNYNNVSVISRFLSFCFFHKCVLVQAFSRSKKQGECQGHGHTVTGRDSPMPSNDISHRTHRTHRHLHWTLNLTRTYT